MRALEVLEPGGLDNLKLVEKPEPKPGAGEVLVRIRAASLNFRDLLMVNGAYGGGLKFPITPFSDGCGVIEAVGPSVTRVKVGDRVSTLFFQKWLSGRPTTETQMSALGGPVGAGRELVVLSQDGVAKVPDFLSDHQVATLACAALTAWRGLFEDARLEPGQTVLLQGTGGVSIFGLQFAHAAGLETIITSSSDEKLARAKKLGATHTINYKTHPEWSGEVRRLTNRRGVDFVMEVGGAQTLKESFKSIVIGGHIAIIGVLSGAAEPLFIPALIGTSARIQGLSVGSRAMFESLCRAMELHKISPVVDKVYPMREARAAFEAMMKGEHFGKIVLDFTK
ncbi:MAG: NAD(P)-dependent alcohol dehydrogenase [Proteobacteria bacterium]|nr:NAD(P)-dependent alcohol dehydrogenase [Pseudomonadota bacterium]